MVNVCRTQVMSGPKDGGSQSDADSCHAIGFAWRLVAADDRGEHFVAFEHCGGYEPSLRAAHAQGCEDMLIAMRIAEQYQFRVVRRHVTGYRYTPTSMSGDVLQMMRSFEQIRARYLASHPEFAAELDAHRYDMCQWLFQRALRVDRYADAVHLYSQLAEWRGREAVTGILRIAPRLARGAVFEALKAPVRGLLKSVRQPRPFFLPELEPQ